MEKLEAGLQVAGYICIVTAGFLVSIELGLAALGASFVAVGKF